MAAQQLLREADVNNPAVLIADRAIVDNGKRLVYRQYIAMYNQGFHIVTIPFLPAPGRGSSRLEAAPARQAAIW